MWKRIQSYALQATVSTELSAVHLKLDNGDRHSVNFHSYEKFAIVVDMLRNEKPVFFHTGREIFHTSWEPVGDGEQ